MKAWAKANPTLAAKVKKGQSGYDAIQSVLKGSKTKSSKPAAKSTKSKAASSSDAQNLRTGRSPDPIPKKKKKKKEVLPYFGGNGIGRY